MTNIEKIRILQELIKGNFCGEEKFYIALETMGDLKGNYHGYMTTEPISCDTEMKRLPEANYDLCTALLTMLLREDHFSNGSFERRCQAGQIQPLIERMIELLQ